MLGRLAVAMGLLAGLLAWPAAAQTGGGFLKLEGHGGPIKGVAASPDGRRALTASFDYALGLWDLHEGRLIRWLDGHEAAANAAVFLSGDRALSVGDDFDMILWDLLSGRVLRRFEGHQGKLLSVAVSADENLAATAGWDGRIGLWPLAGGDPVWLDGHKSNVNAAVFSDDGAWLYTASYDGTIRRWDVAAGREDAVLVSHGFGVNHLVLNEGAGWLAYGAVDGTVRALDLATGAEIADLTADRRPILALAPDADDRLIAVGDGEGHIMVVDTESWSIIRDFRAALNGPIWALAWDAGGDRLLAGGIADEAVAWPMDASEGLVFADGARSFHTDPAEMSNGERQFVRKCSICHSLTPDGGRKAGPSLYGVFGREAGSLPGYSYSQALRGSDIVWTDETIARLFEEGPDHVTPGSKMPMQVIARDVDRADLVAYLKEQTQPE